LAARIGDGPGVPHPDRAALIAFVAPRLASEPLARWAALALAKIVRPGDLRLCLAEGGWDALVQLLDGAEHFAEKAAAFVAICRIVVVADEGEIAAVIDRGLFAVWERWGASVGEAVAKPFMQALIRIQFEAERNGRADWAEQTLEWIEVAV
jgi:hypothetical protein